MKNITITKKLDFKTFVEGMEKGYSGGGTSKEFTFNTFNGEKQEFSVSQNLMLMYQNYCTAKQILINQLAIEK